LNSNRSWSILKSKEKEYTIHRSFIDAAHQLPHVPDGHPCGRLHGHRFYIAVGFERSPPAEWLQLWTPIHHDLHQKHLNQYEEFQNPTSEVIASVLYQRLKKIIPTIAWVCVQETQTTGSLFDGKHHHIWKSQRFESAILLDDGGYSGRSFDIKLHLCGHCDMHFGWIRDFSQVKQIFKPIYDHVLDHQTIDKKLVDTPLAQWIMKHLSPNLPELSAVELYDGYMGIRYKSVERPDYGLYR
jgi:6-pyruvoyltetrahydropterin/6-carboxytetrahydropterin synthase